MSTALATVQPVGAAIEQVLIQGDISRLTAEQRVSYYNAVCASVGLNPLTRPFEYITLNGKLTLYARRDATDQLRKIHGVSVQVASREVVEDCYVVTALATDRNSRTDTSIGVVSIGGLKGETRANAMMKSETKAKRRVTLSICGLGMLDETETDSVPGAAIPLVLSPPKAVSSGSAASIPTTPANTATPSADSVASSTAQAEPLATPPQVRLLAIALGELGIKDKDDRLRWISDLVGRIVTSSKELTVAECSMLIDKAKAGVVAEERDPGMEG